MQNGDETLDTMFLGKVKLFQSQKGYRFTIDSVLLSAFSCQFATQEMLDVGTGNAVVPLLTLHYLEENGRILPSVVGIELQESLLQHAEKNRKENQREEHLELVLGDIRHWKSQQRFALVTMNPPYFTPNTAQCSNQERATGRSQQNGTLKELLQGISKRLAPQGVFTMVYPSNQLLDCLADLQKQGLFPFLLRMVHASEEAASNLVLIASSRVKKPLVIEAPLVLKKGLEDSLEAQSLLSGFLYPR